MSGNNWSQQEMQLLDMMRQIPSDNEVLHRRVRELLFGPEHPGAPQFPKPEGVLNSRPDDWVVDRATGEYWHKTLGKMISGTVSDKTFLASRELAHEWIKRDQLAQHYIGIFRITIDIRNSLHQDGLI